MDFCDPRALLNSIVVTSLCMQKSKCLCVLLPGEAQWEDGVLPVAGRGRQNGGGLGQIDDVPR